MHSFCALTDFQTSTLFSYFSPCMSIEAANPPHPLSKGGIGEGKKITLEQFKDEVLRDYKVVMASREMSLMGRKEVLTGKAKFGIFGDGKELAQVALAKAFKLGDWRSGYYRDQTWMMALGELTVEQFFSQLYANPDKGADPFSSGRQMNAHFATPLQDDNGNWLDLTKRYNSTADASPTASQMPRALGIALASKLYRLNPELAGEFPGFTNNGDEISFVSIGDASTSEGLFWETINAAGVQKVPLAVNVWDDGYGISVPKKYQTTKSSISEVLSGFEVNEDGEGFDIYICEGWNYPKLVATYKKGIDNMRKTHRPALFHITEVTQPQGHSTSGSHERYKDAERLQWEKDFDGVKKFREWILENEIADEAELKAIDAVAKREAQEGRNAAWKKFNEPIKAEIAQVVELLEDLAAEGNEQDTINATIASLKATIDPIRKDIIKTAKTILRQFRGQESQALSRLRRWTDNFVNKYQEVYSSHLHSENPQAALKVAEVKAEYSDDSKMLNGFEILNIAFDKMFTAYPNIVAFGEDVGKIGDVNQGFAGIQEKYGEERIFDAGIREATIMGQAIGLAMRGFRPIAEIQYLDYLLYGLQTLSDDLASLLYRTKGIQKAPLIIRTRGHRLEGIWHTGSPMGMIINSLRGIHICVPRNMVQAAGMYNTLLQSDEPALLIECLNGYRLKERMPDNIDTFTVPLGVPEVIQEGSDVTLVTYGSTIRIAQEAIAQLKEVGISVELIDIQTLLPFDINGMISESIKKTNRVVFLDEDVPGGASAYMFQQVFEKQHIFQYLDAPPITISAKAHRTPYGSDGDYFSKPNAEEIFETIYTMMSEVAPGEWPEI
jgi:pyruvate/2-oxoglutarate/acetoin dehydrogenase E1 component/TPP-dependent pyruvate/acetoin dehydrogenase alpha subunit